MLKKLLISLLFLHFPIISLNAQQFDWVTRAGGLEYDYGRTVAIGNDGDIFVGGYFGPDYAMFDTVQVWNMEYDDGFLARYDGETGELQWVRNIPSTSEIRVLDMAVDDQNNVTIIGDYSDVITFGAQDYENNGFLDIFLAKYTPEGELLWSKAFGGYLMEMGHALTLDANGNILIAILFSGPMLIDSTEVTDVAYNDLLVAKFDPEGTLLWTQAYGGNGEERPLGMEADTEGNIIVGGMFTQEFLFPDTTLHARGWYDGFVLKLDSLGEYQWARNIGGEYALDSVNDVVTDSANRITIIGDIDVRWSIEEMAVPGHGAVDMGVVQLTPDGYMRWADAYGGLSYDGGHGLLTLPDNSLLIGGQFRDVAHFGSFEMTTDLNHFNIFLLQATSDGTVEWVVQAGNDASVDFLWEMAAHSTDAIYFTGTYDENTWIGEHYVRGYGYEDILIGKYSRTPPSGTVSVPTFLPTFNLSTNYPNPFNASTTFQITSQQTAHLQISIFNIRGEIVRILYSDELQPGTYTFQWDGRTEDGHVLPSSTYFLQAKTKSKTINKKLLLLK